MSETRPSVATDETQPFWDGIAAGRLMMPFDEAANAWVWPPAHDGFVWKQVSGTGRVESYSTVHRAPSANHARQGPYTIAFVTLDEGIRLFTRIVDCAEQNLAIGMRVCARFEPVDGEQQPLAVFAPLEPGALA